MGRDPCGVVGVCARSAFHRARSCDISILNTELESTNAINEIAGGISSWYNGGHMAAGPFLLNAIQCWLLGASVLLVLRAVCSASMGRLAHYFQDPAWPSDNELFIQHADSFSLRHMRNSRHMNAGEAPVDDDLRRLASVVPVRPLQLYRQLQESGGLGGEAQLQRTSLVGASKQCLAPAA